MWDSSGRASGFVGAAVPPRKQAHLAAAAASPGGHSKCRTCGYAVAPMVEMPFGHFHPTVAGGTVLPGLDSFYSGVEAQLLPITPLRATSTTSATS